MDCPDVSQVIHLGPPNDKELYAQETGCADRNGSLALAVLLLRNRRDRFIERTMDTYITNIHQPVDKTVYFRILTSTHEERFVNSVHAVIFVLVHVCVVNVL